MGGRHGRDGQWSREAPRDLPARAYALELTLWDRRALRTAEAAPFVGYADDIAARPDGFIVAASIVGGVCIDNDWSLLPGMA